MNTWKRILLFFVLPVIAPLFYPPEIVAAALPVIGFAILVFGVLGFLIWRGYSLALTLSIFIQGLNVIIRMMMFFPHSVNRAGELDVLFLVASLLSIALSFYLLLRLDRVDVRLQMVA